jgi:hypothetical protein
MKKTILIVLLSVFLVSAMTVPALAQDFDLGVEVGDWFKYEAKVTQWEGDMEFLPEGFQGPLILAENQTNFILYTVTDITPVDGGNNVTFTVTYDWENGSETEGTSVTPVSTDVESLYTVLTGANLEPGDMVIDTFLFFGFAEIPTQYINETIDFENPDGTRETNVLEYSIEIFGSFYDYKTLFDKETGMRLYYENHGDVAAFGEQVAYEYTVVWELVESSYETLYIPDLTGPIMLLTLIAITIPIVLHKRKTLKH